MEGVHPRLVHLVFGNSQQLALSHMSGGAVLTPAQLLEQQKKANATMIEMEERRLEKMQRRQVTQHVSWRLTTFGYP